MGLTCPFNIMNAIDATKPTINITGFKGLWSRGYNDNCPLDHLQVCNNCSFPGPGQVGIRESVTYSSSISGRTIISYQVITPSTVPILLTLDASGVLRDETNSVTLHTFIGADDFIAISVFGRVFISAKYQGKALHNNFVYYYDGTNFALVGGGGPISGPTLAQVNPGIVYAGIHGVAVSFQYRNGFISKPSPIAYITSTGTNDIEVSGIAIGGSAVVGRVIFMTQANQTELFYVPLGTINDNTTTTFTINSVDTALTASADYLNDILPNIPSCSSMRFYNGRLIYIGLDTTSNTAPDQVLVSGAPVNSGGAAQINPETVDLVTGVVNMPEDFGINTTNTGMVLRGVLYLCKPFGTYGTQDNGNDPGTWPLNVIDTALGSYDTGISLFNTAFSGQDTLDQCFIITSRGLMLFNGQYQDPPLSYKIEGYWQNFTISNFYKCKIAHDINLKRVYLIFWYYSSQNTVINSSLFMMDYTEGLDAHNVKWSTWDLGTWGAINGIGRLTVENFTASYGTTAIYNLTFCLGGASIYKFAFPPASEEIPLYGDLQTYAINQVITTANLSFGLGINQFTVIDQSTVGYGNLLITLQDKRQFSPNTQTVTGFNLSKYNPALGNTAFIQAAGSDLYRGINFLSESMSITLTCNNTHSQTGYSYNLVDMFVCTGISVYGKVMYKLRPAVTQNQ